MSPSAALHFIVDAEVRDEAGDVIEKKAWRLLLRATNSKGRWRLVSTAFQALDSDEIVKEFEDTHPAAQELILP